MYNFKYLKPDSLESLLSLLETCPGAVAVAGGTDVMVQLRAGKLRADTIIDLLIPELTGIHDRDGCYVIGASTPLEQVSDYFRALPQPYFMLHQAVDSVGSCLTRSLATIAGNFCTGNASSDLATALIALDATIEIQKSGEKRFLPIENFFIRNRVTALDPGEIVTAIYIPRQPCPAAGASFIKIGKRRGHVIAILNVAAMVGRDENGACSLVRMAAGTLAGTPVRLYRSEEEFLRRLSDGDDLNCALEAVSQVMLTEINPRDSQRASREYRQQVGPVALCRAVREAWGDKLC